VSIVQGVEKLTLTGQLGDVMKESVSAAITYIRANAELLGVAKDFNQGKEIHVHVPEGAIPKDGPSAGITMAVAVISAAAQRAVRSDVAMTGEITLRGRILPIGGLTEKLLAARRANVKTVVIPMDNLKDLADISDKVKQGLEIVPVTTLIEAVPYIFRTPENTPPPAPKPRSTPRPRPVKAAVKAPVTPKAAPKPAAAAKSKAPAKSVAKRNSRKPKGKA
jgi:ATP-dependent Lon protease